MKKIALDISIKKNLIVIEK